MPRRLLADILLVILGSVALLAAGSALVGLRQWHINGWTEALNDQVGYVSVGRNLAEKGELSSNIIYTATLSQKASKTYLYMPGHYFALAASFKLLGAGPWQSVMPSLACYCVAAVCIFLSGRRLYGRGAGFLAAGVFAVLPASFALSFTAMAELTVIAAVSAAFCVFVHLPPKVRPYAGPALLALPFLFRETTALLVIPMAAMVLGGIPLLRRMGWRQWLAAALLCVVSVAVLAAVFKSPVSAGRPSLIAANVFGAGEWNIYQDVTVWDRIPAKAGPAAWARAMAHNMVTNLKRIPDLRLSRPGGFEAVNLGLLLAAPLFCLALGLWRRDELAFSAGVMGIAAWLMVLSLYHIGGHRGMRALLFTWPVLAIVIGGWLAGRFSRSSTASASLRPTPVIAAAAIVAMASLALGLFAVHEIAGGDDFGAEMVSLVESAGHDPARVIASDFRVGLKYALLHHPVKWAFIPANPESLSLLRKKYDVGTLIVSPRSARLPDNRLKNAGIVLEKEIRWRGRPYQVYKVPPRPVPAPSMQRKAWER